MVKVEYVPGIPGLTDGVILRMRSDEARKLLEVLPRGIDHVIDELRYQLNSTLETSKVSKTGSW